MSTILDYLDELREGFPVEDACPDCGRMQWWRKYLGTASGAFLNCFAVGSCNFVLELDDTPPAILCSRCGVELHQVPNGFHCFPCGRTVEP